MPSWKKVIVSGSDARFATLFTSGHVTASANISGSGLATASFGKILGDGSEITGITSVTSESIQNLRVGIVSGSEQVSYDGNRRVLNTDLGDLFDNNFNPGTSGSVVDFLNAVFYPNTPPNICLDQAITFSDL